MFGPFASLCPLTESLRKAAKKRDLFEKAEPFQTFGSLLGAALLSYEFDVCQQDPVQKPARPVSTSQSLQLKDFAI